MKFTTGTVITQLGLKHSGRFEMIENMVKNFAHLISTIGYIPMEIEATLLGVLNSFFSLMVRLLAEEKGPNILAEYYQEMETEYLFWIYVKEKVNAQTLKMNIVF